MMIHTAEVNAKFPAGHSLSAGVYNSGNLLGTPVKKCDSHFQYPKFAENLLEIHMYHKVSRAEHNAW